jgi:hypothetical protein
MKVKAEVKKDGETVEDPSKDPKFRREANSVLNKANDEIIKALKPNGEGKVEIDIGNDYSLSLDADDITTDGNFDAELVKSKIREAMGIDESLTDTITQAITKAFSSLPEAIEKLDTNKLTTIEQSFTSALTALQNLATSSFWDTLARKIATIVDSIKQL